MHNKNKLAKYKNTSNKSNTLIHYRPITQLNSIWYQYRHLQIY